MALLSENEQILEVFRSQKNNLQWFINGTVVLDAKKNICLLPKTPVRVLITILQKKKYLFSELVQQSKIIKLYGVSDKVNHNRQKGHLRVSILNYFFLPSALLPFWKYFLWSASLDKKIVKSAWV